MNTPGIREVKLLHYEDPDTSHDFEELLLELPGKRCDEVLFSDITSTSSESESSDRYAIYCSPECCWIYKNESKDFLIKMDQISENTRNPSMLARHPNFTAVHRAQIVDWLMETSHFFKACRETYYQALDILDRFLSASSQLLLSQQDLLGITCFHIASKMEEVYPIKLYDLLYLANEIEEEDVYEMEQKVLIAIGWRCSLWTANQWLHTMLHVSKYVLSKEEYLRITDLLDIVMFDVDSLHFSYSVLASSCLHLVASLQITYPSDSQTQKLNICECISWMKSYWQAVKEMPLSKKSLHSSKNHSCKLLNYSTSQQYKEFFKVYQNFQCNET